MDRKCTEVLSDPKSTGLEISQGKFSQRSDGNRQQGQEKRVPVTMNWVEEGSELKEHGLSKTLKQVQHGQTAKSAK